MPMMKRTAERESAALSTGASVPLDESITYRAPGAPCFCDARVNHEDSVNYQLPHKVLLGLPAKLFRPSVQPEAKQLPNVSHNHLLVRKVPYLNATQHKCKSQGCACPCSVTLCYVYLNRAVKD